jgi:hypothetical protein
MICYQSVVQTKKKILQNYSFPITMVVGREAAHTPSRFSVRSSTPEATTYIDHKTKSAFQITFMQTWIGNMNKRICLTIYKVIRL